MFFILKLFWCPSRFSLSINFSVVVQSELDDYATSNTEHGSMTQHLHFPGKWQACEYVLYPICMLTFSIYSFPPLTNYNFTILYFSTSQVQANLVEPVGGGRMVS